MAGPGLAGTAASTTCRAAPRDTVAYTDLLCRLHPVGTPDDAVARLSAGAARTGIGHVVLMVEGSGVRARVLENVRRLGAEVLPRLRT